MGVRQMMTYVKSTIQRPIKLFAPCDPSTGAPASTIIFDAMGCLRRYFNEGSLVWDFEKMLNLVKSDVQAFRSAGFNLVVVLDGGIDEEKFKTWFRRREGELQDLREINSELCKPAFLPRKVSKDNWNPPQSSGMFLGQAFKAAGCEVFYSLGDADPEAAWLAIDRRAFGVLTCDTDFLIYPGIEFYLDSNTLRIGPRGEISVGAVRVSDLAEHLDLPAHRMGEIVGFMGNDVIEGTCGYHELKHLRYKHGVKFGIDAVAVELRGLDTEDLPGACRRAVDYYKPVEPDKEPWSGSMLGKVLLKKQVYVRGVALESLRETPGHDLFLPLRKAVYARIGLNSVKEHACSPRRRPEQWLKGFVVRVHENIRKAPAPPADPGELSIFVCQALQALGAIDDFYFKALTAQIVHRNQLLCKFRHNNVPKVPNLKDFHVANLYLHAIDIMWMGCNRAQPPCWATFHGPLFYFLCNENKRHLLDDLPFDFENGPDVDWKHILCG